MDWGIEILGWLVFVRFFLGVVTDQRSPAAAAARSQKVCTM